MTRAVPLTPIVEALEEAGLLAGIRGELPTAVTAVADDSRRATDGALFLAVRGAERDGHDYLPEAMAAGASTVMLEDPARSELPAIIVRDGRLAAAVAAAVAFEYPARALRLVAVTGTNGKTTTVGILRHLLDGSTARSASIGTLGTLVGSAGAGLAGGSGAALTTPGPLELQATLRRLADAGVRSVAMEVSSHSLDQRRVEGLEFEAAVFTNFTRDHLDYHGSMEAYFAAKARLIDLLAAGGAAIVNADDPAWASLPRAPHRLTFGLAEAADVRAEALRLEPEGSEWRLAAAGQRHSLTLPLLGAFNVPNALGAAAAAWRLGVPLGEIAGRLRHVPQIPGRLEVINERPRVLRDYAHTPDALERTLAAVRPFVRGALIVVFGCGGDRDRGKRPTMGAIAERCADRVILTSDNPRTEDPEEILDDIERGMRGTSHKRIEDRRAAIARALEIADARRDLVLLAGKGHERHQIRGPERLPFDERAIVAELVAARTPGDRAP